MSKEEGDKENEGWLSSFVLFCFVFFLAACLFLELRVL